MLYTEWSNSYNVIDRKKKTFRKGEEIDIF